MKARKYSRDEGTSVFGTFEGSVATQFFPKDVSHMICPPIACLRDNMKCYPDKVGDGFYVRPPYFENNVRYVVLGNQVR